MTTKDAIKHLSYKIAYCEEIGDNWADSVNIDAIKIAVRAMAEERKKGNWYLRDTSRYGGLPFICTVCSREADSVYGFCPNCGSDMRGEKDE